MKEEAQKTYRTSDLYFSAFLCSQEVFFQGIERKKDGKVIFLFLIDEESLENDKELFFGARGEVNAYRFVENIRRLKSICHN